jgi:hypothetical protein
MADPRRWLDDDGASRAAVDLLRTLEAPKAAPAATRAALGKELASMVAAGTAPVAAGFGTAKLVVLALAVAGASTGAAVWKLARRPTSDAPAAVAIPAIAPPEAPATGSEATVEPPAPLAPSARPLDRPRAASAPPAPSAERDRLAEEEAILEEARETLARDPVRALTLLRRHQSRFPTGELTAERMYLGVDALARLGKREAAKREADALIERYPTSAYARRAPLLLAGPAR